MYKFFFSFFSREKGKPSSAAGGGRDEKQMLSEMVRPFFITTQAHKGKTDNVLLCSILSIILLSARRPFFFVGKILAIFRL